VKSSTQSWNGVDLYKVQPACITPHSARATFATVADERGVPIQDIKTTLGMQISPLLSPTCIQEKKHKDSTVFLLSINSK